jgi:hypothetical protein
VLWGSRPGCLPGRRGLGCQIHFGFVRHPSQNPHTGTIFFWSNCDPFPGQNPDGWQVFAMQPDGSGLRQLTDARGAVRGADNTIEYESVDAFLNAPH